MQIFINFILQKNINIHYVQQEAKRV